MQLIEGSNQTDYFLVIPDYRFSSQMTWVYYLQQNIDEVEKL
jgi:hypothetical protein